MSDPTKVQGGAGVEQEVRFALVLYGGVSLAIYINGVVQEMLRLVRSTSPVAGQLDAIEKVYRKLGQAIAPGVVPTKSPGADAPVRTRFCIDVISGTSAGGINGIFLAKALANNTGLDALQNLWFEQGALEKLLNDGKSQEDLPFGRPPATRSLLNSQRMYYELLQAFKGMNPQPSAPARAPLADRISLFATTTDIEGVPLPIQLWDEIVYERRYRNVFRLRFYPDGPFEQGRNDFGEACDPFLAFAARCTSSFPFAFEPMRLEDIDPVLKADPDFKDRFRECGSGAGQWQKFFQQYLGSASNGAASNEAFSKRAFGDGGYLNNKPFSYAIDALSETESDLPVKRKLMYVEPSPEHPELEPQPAGPPNAIQNSLDALVTIPGYQTIREDLARALDRNAIITRVNQAIREIEAEGPPDPSAVQAAIEKGTVEEISFDRENPSLRQYYRLRATDVTDQLTDLIARAYSIEDGSAPYKCLRAVLHTWRVRTYESTAKRDRFDFLRDFDLPYRLRRLRFLIRKFDMLTAQGAPNGPDHESYKRSLQFAGIEAGREGSLAPLRSARSTLVTAYRTLLSLRRSLLQDDLDPRGAARDGASPNRQAAPPLASVREILGPPAMVRDFLQGLLPARESTRAKLATSTIRRSSGDPGETEDLVRIWVEHRLSGEDGQDVLERLRQLGDRLATQLQLVLTGPDVARALEMLHAEARPLLPFFISFDLFDSTIFPIVYGTPAGDGVPVEIVRLSPEDVSALEPDPLARRRKLKGLAVAHFGAFLDETWRRNDLLWGRLDAAERLISTLLPLDESSALRDQLIDEAHAAILTDFKVTDQIRAMALQRLAGKRGNVRFGRANAEHVIAELTAPSGATVRERNRAAMQNWKTVVPDEMERKLLLEDVARASQITGEILDDITAGKSLPPAATWLTRGGRILWGLVELAAPRAAWNVAFRYWAQILYLIAILLIAGGVISGAVQLTQFGWSLLGLTFGTHLLTMWLNSFMKGPNWLAAFGRAFVVIVAGAVLVLLGLGIGQTWWLADRVLEWADRHPIYGVPHLRPAVINVAVALAIPLLLVVISVLSRGFRHLARRMEYRLRRKELDKASGQQAGKSFRQAAGGAQNG